MLALHRINARDRRRAAAHEAGHIVIAQHFGVEVLGAAIWPVDRDDPLLEATWSGPDQRLPGCGQPIRCLAGDRSCRGSCRGDLVRSRWSSRPGALLGFRIRRGGRDVDERLETLRCRTRDRRRRARVRRRPGRRTVSRSPPGRADQDRTSADRRSPRPEHPDQLKTEGHNK